MQAYPPYRMPQVKPSKHIELGVHGVSAASCSTGAVVVEANGDVPVLDVVGSDEDITGRSLTTGLPGRASRALLTCTTAALTTVESRMNTESIVVQDSFTINQTGGLKERKQHNVDLNFVVLIKKSFRCSAPTCWEHLAAHIVIGIAAKCHHRDYDVVQCSAGDANRSLGMRRRCGGAIGM